MSSLASFGHALLGARRVAPPVVPRPATPRWPGAATRSADKNAAGEKVVAAGQALLAAQAEAAEARRALLRASMDCLVSRGRSGERAHELRLAKAAAEQRAEAALQVVQARQSWLDAAVHAFNAAA